MSEDLIECQRRCRELQVEHDGLRRSEREWRIKQVAAERALTAAQARIEAQETERAAVVAKLGGQISGLLGKIAEVEKERDRLKKERDESYEHEHIKQLLEERDDRDVNYFNCLRKVEKERDEWREEAEAEQVNAAVYLNERKAVERERDEARAALAEAVAYVDSGLAFCAAGAEIHQMAARWSAVLSDHQTEDKP